MKLINIYNEIAPVYDSFYKSPRHFVEEEIIATFLPDMDKAESVLDIGCGTGNMISVGQLHPKSYYGIDISSEMLKSATEKYPDYTFAQADGSDMVLHGCWDLVLTIFGQLNYMGLANWCESMIQNMHHDEYAVNQKARFLSVMYSSDYRPDYLDSQASGYTPQYIKRILHENGLACNIWGLSYPLPMEENMDFASLLDTQTHLTNSGDLTGCRYWIIEGGWLR